LGPVKLTCAVSFIGLLADQMFLVIVSKNVYVSTSFAFIFKLTLRVCIHFCFELLKQPFLFLLLLLMLLLLFFLLRTVFVLILPTTTLYYYF